MFVSMYCNRIFARSQVLLDASEKSQPFFSEHTSQSIHVFGFYAAENISVLENSRHRDLRNNRKCLALMILAVAVPGCFIDMSISEQHKIKSFFPILPMKDETRVLMCRAALCNYTGLSSLA